MRCHWTEVVCATLLLISGTSASANAQTDRPAGHEYEVVAGVMMPAGFPLRNLRPGPTVRVGVVTPWPETGGDGYPGLPGIVRAGVGVRGALRGVDVQLETAGVGWIRAIGETRMFPLTIVLRF